MFFGIVVAVALLLVLLYELGVRGIILRYQVIDCCVPTLAKLNNVPSKWAKGNNISLSIEILVGGPYFRELRVLIGWRQRGLNSWIH